MKDVLMLHNAVPQNMKSRVNGTSDTSISSTFAAPSTPFQEVVLDLQFAIDAGDQHFAPALKLLLQKALQLARASDTMPPHDYQLALETVKLSYLELLDMETTHPVAKSLQMHYKRTYHDSFWSFLEYERVLFSKSADKNVVACKGNLEKHTYFLCKRAMDIVIASVLVVSLAPLLALIAVFIKLDSPGSALFVQERVGVKRKTRARQTVWEISNFRMYKFRTMHQNADQSLHQKFTTAWTRGELEETQDKRAKFKLDNDPRITRIGALLRKTSLDELPQLFNVIKGEMSLVGPRPVPIYEAAEYTAEHQKRLASLPGITGLWQVKGRGQVTFEEQVRLDVEYIHNQSLWTDFEILFLTIPAVIRGSGAK
jgi:lipopolysaccharide/colanic/teichoic acid biosynthesis glycosyltransferase